MPTYDYQCRSCGHRIEVIHAMTDQGPSVCERCGGEMRRILFPAGIIFKGSGFYKTDSRAASGADGASSGSSSKGSSPDKAGSGPTSPAGSSSGSGD